MSHFSVWVFSKTPEEEEIEKLLMPYQEYDGQEHLKNYIEFNSITEEYTKKYNEEKREMIKIPLIHSFESRQADCSDYEDDWVVATAKFNLFDPNFKLSRCCDNDDDVDKEGTGERIVSNRDEQLVMTLKELVTDDYQNRCGGSIKSDVAECIGFDLDDDGFAYLSAEFKNTTEESAEAWLREFIKNLELSDYMYIFPWDNRLKVEVTEDEYKKYSGDKQTDYFSQKSYNIFDPSVLNGEKVEVYLTEIYNSFNEYMENLGYKVNKEQNDYGYFRNPNSKWDWWVVGGRWNNIPTFENINVNQCKVSDINFFPDINEINNLRRFWEINVDGETPTELEKNSGEFWSMFKPEYYLERYKTKENYVNIKSSVKPYAFVDVDGTWYEQGEMGWFGCDSADSNSIDAYVAKFNETIKNINKDYYVTGVDCHI